MKYPDDYKGRAKAQDACIRRWMSATALGPECWASMGYAEAFDKAWESKVRDFETLYVLSLNVKNKVGDILRK